MVTGDWGAAASGLVDKAKAQDTYDEKTQVEIKARAVQRLEQEAKKAQAASNAAAELLKPGGQVRGQAHMLLGLCDLAQARACTSVEHDARPAISLTPRVAQRLFAS